MSGISTSGDDFRAVISPGRLRIWMRSRNACIAGIEFLSYNFFY